MAASLRSEPVGRLRMNSASVSKRAAIRALLK
jgi:hypothetical protein